MKEASPQAHVDRLVRESNFLGAYLYLKEANLEAAERSELVGVLAGAVANELSRCRRDDKERIYFLRSILAWILRDVPGLGSLYREQLRESQARVGLLNQFTRGIQNAGEVAAGRKSVSEGIQDAAEDVRRNIEDAAETVRSGETGSSLNDFLKSAEDGIRQGLDQLGEFFKVVNDRERPEDDESAGRDSADSEERRDGSDAESAARAAADGDVEDVQFESDGPQNTAENPDDK